MFSKTASLILQEWSKNTEYPSKILLSFVWILAVHKIKVQKSGIRL